MTTKNIAGSLARYIQGKAASQKDSSHTREPTFGGGGLGAVIGHSDTRVESAGIGCELPTVLCLGEKMHF